FHNPEKRRFGVVLTGDVQTAQQAYRELKGGAPLRRVVMAYSVDEETKATNGETADFTKGAQDELGQVGFTLKKVGDVAEPFQTSRGWVVLTLVERIDD